MVKITTQWLLARHACANQVLIFEQEWPQGGEVTKDTLNRALELGLDLEWFANSLPLSPLAWAEYERMRTPARMEFERMMALAQVEFERVKTLAQVEYQRVTTPALIEAILAVVNPHLTRLEARSALPPPKGTSLREL